MSSQGTIEAAGVGDVVIIAPHRVGDVEQFGEILEVFPGRRPHYRVRWEDDHESIFFPGSDAIVRPASRRRRPS
jgi:Domain of unknown function (DUF1918)